MSNVQREPYCLVVRWKDPKKEAADPDSPFTFGPYFKKEEAEAAAKFIEDYQDADGDPDEERVVAEIGTYKTPGMLRMFMAL